MTVKYPIKAKLFFGLPKQPLIFVDLPAGRVGTRVKISADDFARIFITFEDGTEEWGVELVGEFQARPHILINSTRKGKDETTR